MAGRPAPPTEVTNVVRSFAARGIIRELPAEGKSVVVRHEAIPGFMPKMTMEFTVRDPKELRGLKAGDAISFRVKANEGESWIEGIQRTDETASAPLTARSEPTSGSLLHASQLKPGDLLPDVELLAEDGHPIQLSDFRGRALAFTFIFTRCPLPDFCPRMSQRFNGARELLRQRTAGPTNWQFLSISFDPEVDRPEVLARYARRYRGDEPDRWLFASATTNALASLATSIDFRAANENGSFVHNLRTVVLDPQQHIYRQFDGNRWTAEDLAQALLEAARVKP